ncbi:MAG: ferrous iron transport protein B [Spirochaetaceae bacterium]
MQSDRIRVAVIGNPNTGKTTLFNGLTGSRQRVGNWPGVTVEKKEGVVALSGMDQVLTSPYLPTPGHTEQPIVGEAKTRLGEVELVDLPGIYTLSASSEDEIIARDYLLSGEADLVIDIVDASNLERNLYLTLQLIEMGLPVLVVLNKMDMAKKEGITIDVDHLSKHLDTPVVAISAVTTEGIRDSRNALQAALSDKRGSTATVSYPEVVESVAEGWKPRLSPLAERFGVESRWLSLQLLEGNAALSSRVVEADVLNFGDIEEAQNEVEKKAGDEADIILADARYGFIHGVAKDVMKRGISRKRFTEVLDRFALSRVTGIPIFLAVMYLVFWLTIAVGGAFIDFFDILFGTVFVDGFGELLGAVGSPEWLTQFLAGGIGSGIQTVATFVPILFFMFGLLALLEDSGYMARAAFVMDRFMRWIGLPGKSFIPMMVGFGCTVPAIMGTRTLESKKDRYMTIFMSPFMSCGARLPVYALFAAAFFPAFAGGVVFSLYLAGIVLAVITGLLLKRTLFRGEVSHFIMELPPYHKPRVGHILRTAWHRLRLFVVRAGITITVVVTILAGLNSFGIDGSFGQEDTEDSVLSAIGKTITPIFTPMGVEQDNWPATVGLFTGLFAKEAVVGTLNSLYAMDQSEPEAAAASEESFDFWGGIGESFATIPRNLAGVGAGLADPLGLGLVGQPEEALVDELGTDGALFTRMRGRFTTVGAYAYLLFVLIYFPCVAALGAAVREMGSFFGWLLVGYLTVLAWALSTLLYQFASGPQLLPSVIAFGLIGLIVVTFTAIGSRESHKKAMAA